MNTKYLDLYTDYLAVTFGYATATGLSDMLDGSDTVEEKPWMDKNNLIARHYDHCTGRGIKGINMLNCLYHVSDVSIPAAFELIQKPIRFSDLKTRREKRRSEVTKNELLRSMVDTCIKNRIKFKRILFDLRFSSVENPEHIKLEHKKEVIGALKNNRLVALTEEDQRNKRFTRIDQLDRPEQEAVTGRLNGLKFPVRLVRQIFTNKDGSTGTLYLVCTRLTADRNTITTIYKKTTERRGVP